MRALLLVLALTGAALAQPKGPILGAAGDLGQTFARPVVRADVPVLRDEIFWANVERDGAFVFDTPRATYPDLLRAGFLFLATAPHPDHDGGTTPHSAEGVAAFASYVAAVLQRFPQVRQLEVGNEMNSASFASGPGWDGPLAQRADSYVRLLKATATEARRVRPGIRVLGGAAHSIPIAWLKALFDRGAARWMDALVLHPYGIAPEDLGPEVDRLHQEVPASAALPLAITEFGWEKAGTAPAYLVKSYCVQALAGAELSVWYPLNPRGDGMAPLQDAAGRPTAAGRSFAFLRGLQGVAVRPFRPDPFTWGCRFNDLLILWGAPRAVALTAGSVALDLAGEPAPLGHLSREEPLIVRGEVRLGPQEVLADSRDQFWDGPFQWLIRQNGVDSPMTPGLGQDREGVPWTPYLQTAIDGVARAGPGWVQPSAPPAGPIAIVTRYVAPRAMRVRLVVTATAWEAPMRLRVTRNGQPAADEVALAQGDVLDVETGGGGGELRVTLKETGR